ncbi:hypothetical protein RHMOL_Rhmol03G0182800 [Rhododendron molle]|uniref:Uncharacterized protein n=1 Tax=Rhododendron molle TaxID=49168 RepID=A0ACC0PH29_RHOML|nr:hypothetical protein RHMOL_Rhmol03G0182800 [Rhododendron molle]
MTKSSSTKGLPPCPESNHMTNMVKNRAFDFSILLLLFLGSLYLIISIPSRLRPIFSSPNPPRNSSTTFEMIVQRDELDTVLAETSTENKTVIIAVVNKAYVEGDKSMLDLFMDSFWLGDGTWGLIDHLLIVATDQVSYERCKFLRLHCYKLETDGEDFAGEKVYMSEDFIKMMWRRTRFLGDVLKRGYNFIFTKEVSFWTKEQDVLKALMKNGLFRDLALNVRAKVADLTIVIHDWRRAKGLFANETSTFRWSEHSACVHSWDN